MLLVSYTGCYLFNIYYRPLYPANGLSDLLRKAQSSLQPDTAAEQHQALTTPNQLHNAPSCPSSVSAGNPSLLPQETCSQSYSVHPQLSPLFVLHAPPCYWGSPMMHWPAFLHNYIYRMVFICSVALGRSREQYAGYALELTGLWRPRQSARMQRSSHIFRKPESHLKWIPNTDGEDMPWS